jgi:hypothetical protein
MKLIVETVQADCDQTYELAESFIKALTAFGVYVIDHPDYEGTDAYGFLLSNRPLTEEEIKGECQHGGREG